MLPLTDPMTPVQQQEPSFCAFDLLFADRSALTDLPLIERKERLRELVPESAARLLYVNHIQENGIALYEQICALDLEGIVGKPSQSKYGETGVQWIKIKNPDYSQTEGRKELFDNRT